MEQFLFCFFALMTCGAAVAVVLSQNVVRMAFYLVIALGATSGLFFLLDADFVGGTQLLIYVGGTVVLLIFGVMLTSSSPFASLKNTPAEILQGGFLGAALLAMLVSTVLSVDWTESERGLRSIGPAGIADGYNPHDEGESSRRIGTAMLGVRFDQDLDPHRVPDSVSDSAPGQAAVRQVDSLSTGYLLPFEIISMHLLVVLIGAAYLARAKRRQPQAEGVGQ